MVFVCLFQGNLHWGCLLHHCWPFRDRKWLHLLQSKYRRAGHHQGNWGPAHLRQYCLIGINWVWTRADWWQIFCCFLMFLIMKGQHAQVSAASIETCGISSLEWQLVPRSLQLVLRPLTSSQTTATSFQPYATIPNVSVTSIQTSVTSSQTRVWTL